MQTMHAKLNDMNEVGEQIGAHLHNAPNLNNAINSKMDVLELKWNHLLEQMEYLSKVCTELQQIEIRQQYQQQENDHGETVKKEEEEKDEEDNKSSSGGSSKKKRMLQSEEIKEFTNVDVFVDQANKMFEALQRLLVGRNIDDLSLEAQQDVIRVISAHF